MKHSFLLTRPEHDDTTYYLANTVKILSNLLKKRV